MSVVKIGPLGIPALYEQDGKRITTHSMLKSFLSCPKSAQYKYAERLKTRRSTAREQPLKRGTWVHELLEAYYQGGDWKKKHRENTAKFEMLMDDERNELGDLPSEALRLMRSYLWHYGANADDPFHGWEIIGTEMTFDVPWPDSEDENDIYRCRVDALVRDEYGLLIVDHKTHKTLPSLTFRMLDVASPLYIWAARANGYDVRGFLWNYIKTKAPGVPKMVYVGKPGERLSTAAVDTDYLTYATAIRSYGLDHTAEPYRSKLRQLKRQRWASGHPEVSPFFRREILEKDDDMIARAVGTAMRTRDRMHSDYEDFEVVERVSGRHCDWCSFKLLCEMEMIGNSFGAQHLRTKNYRKGDPLDYYQDHKERNENV
jgi:PD-(D/E)XK nuclease superfamily